MSELEILKNRVVALENMLKSGAQFEETIRDIVFFDVDNVTATTRSAIDSDGDSVTVPKNPTKFAKVYFRGQQYLVALYAVS